MKNPTKFLLTISAAIPCFVFTTSHSQAHSKWNYYRYNYECRTNYGMGDKVNPSHCRTPNHTQKVCRAKDSHTHTQPNISTGPGYVDTDGDGIADTQVTDLSSPCSPCETVANPGPIAGQPTATIGVYPNGTYTSVQTDSVTGQPVIGPNGGLVASPNPPHTYNNNDVGGSDTDMTADHWDGVLN